MHSMFGRYLVYVPSKRRWMSLVTTSRTCTPSDLGVHCLGESNFTTTVNSGLPLTGQPGSGNRGALTSSSLEMSNVELAPEFTNMLITQRGFQANSRIIMASDELLQDLVNINR